MDILDISEDDLYDEVCMIFNVADLPMMGLNLTQILDDSVYMTTVRSNYVRAVHNRGELTVRIRGVCTGVGAGVCWCVYICVCVRVCLCLCV